MLHDGKPTQLSEFDEDLHHLLAQLGGIRGLSDGLGGRQGHQVLPELADVAGHLLVALDDALENKELAQRLLQPSDELPQHAGWLLSQILLRDRRSEVVLLLLARGVGAPEGKEARPRVRLQTVERVSQIQRVVAHASLALNESAQGREDRHVRQRQKALLEVQRNKVLLNVEKVAKGDLLGGRWRVELLPWLGVLRSRGVVEREVELHVRGLEEGVVLERDPVKAVFWIRTSCSMYSM